MFVQRDHLYSAAVVRVDGDPVPYLPNLVVPPPLICNMFCVLLQFLEELINSVLLNHQAVFLGGIGGVTVTIFLRIYIKNVKID